MKKRIIIALGLTLATAAYAMPTAPQPTCDPTSGTCTMNNGCSGGPCVVK